MLTRCRQRTASISAAGGAIRRDSGGASHSRVRANTLKLPPESAAVTAYTVAEWRDGSADRSVVCLVRATVSRPELAARPTLNAMTSSRKGQRKLGLQGLELLGRQSDAVVVAGVTALVGRGRLTGK